MKTYIQSKRLEPHSRISMIVVAFLFGLSLSFGSFRVANAKPDVMGVVNANYVGWENEGEPDDFQRILIHATENDGGFLRIDRAPVTDEWTPELVNYWRNTWLEADVICTSVADNVAVVVAEINRVGEFPAGEETPISMSELFLNYHLAFELTDNGDGAVDTIRQINENPITGGTHTENEMLAMCENGTVEEAGFDPFVGYHSGDIAIYETDRKAFGEDENFEAKYSIPADLELLEDPGVINHGCEGGLYTLVDGKFTDSQDYMFYPNQAAFEAGQPGSLLQATVSADYSGLWDSSDNPGSLYKLKDNSIQAQVYIWPDGTNLTYFNWEGEFSDVDTKRTTDWWHIDVAVNVDGVASGISEGSCGDITNWDERDDGNDESPLGVEADFEFFQDEDNRAQIPWEHQLIVATANNVDGQASLRWSDPDFPDDTYAETVVECVDFGRSFAGEDDYVNFVGYIDSALVQGEIYGDLVGTWFFVQLVRGADEPSIPGEQVMHNAGIIEESKADEMCQEVTPEEIPPEWQTVPVSGNGFINFFDIQI